jgi:hypothetical protein
MVGPDRVYDEKPATLSETRISYSLANFSNQKAVNIDQRSRLTMITSYYDVKFKASLLSASTEYP